MSRKDVERVIRNLDQDGVCHEDTGYFEHEIVQALLSDMDKARAALAAADAAWGWPNGKINSMARATLDDAIEQLERWKA